MTGLVTTAAVFRPRGVACPLHREPNDVYSVMELTPRLRLPPTLVPDYDEIVATTYTARAPVDDPLWPDTEAGWRLRQAYLRHGERALVELPELGEHWCAERS